MSAREIEETLYTKIVLKYIVFLVMSPSVSQNLLNASSKYKLGPFLLQLTDTQ